MGSFYMEATQINYRRDESLKTVDQKLQELSETSAIDTDIAPVFKSTNTYAPGDMVYYRNKLYVFNVEHTGTWAAGDVSATDVTTEISSLKSGLTNVADDVKLNTQDLTTPSRTANLYNKNDEYLLAYINTDNGVIYESTGATVVWIKCKPNTTYTVSKQAGTRFMAATTRVKPALGVQTYGYIKDFTASSITITTDANAVYLVAYVYASTDQPTTREEMLATVQIEEGSTATAYTPYIPSVDSRIEAVEIGLINIAKGYYTSYNDYTKWYHIGNITIPVIKWIRHMSIISVNGSDIRHLIFRSVPTNDNGFNNNETKVVSVYSSTTSATTVGLIISGDKKSVDIYIKGGNLGNRTYSVLSDGGEGTVDYYNPVETDLTDADMTITG